MMLNGVHRRARRHHGRLGLRRPVGRGRNRFSCGRRDRGRRRSLRRADPDRRPDRRGRGAWHGRRLGHARDRHLRRSRPRREPRHGHRGSYLHGQLPPARSPGARPPRGGRVHLQRVVRRALGDEGRVGIRAEPEVETAGLDVSEHGMWGYPEFYIPVPGGYGAERRTATSASCTRPNPEAGDPSLADPGALWLGSRAPRRRIARRSGAQDRLTRHARAAVPEVRSS